MNQPKNQISPSFAFLVRMFVLQQVPVYLTPERASELAIVSAHRREEPTGFEWRRRAAASMRHRRWSRTSSAKTARRREDFDLIPALAGIHDERFHELVKSSPLGLWPIIDVPCARLTLSWRASPYLAVAFARRVYLFIFLFFSLASRVRKH